MSEAILYYAHDPMCSWCWAFRPTWLRIAESLPRGVVYRRLLGGLAPDSDEPMSDDMQRYLQDTWRQIQTRIPGTPFNFDFWRICQPKRSTYPACRAVIAARNQGAAHEEAMILGIQQAYYLRARNPSDEATLISIAEEIGLDRSRFSSELNAADTQLCLDEEMRFGQSMGVQGFPSLVFASDRGARLLSHDYRDHRVVLEQLSEA